MTGTIKVVGSIALRPGMGLAVHGDKVIYEGPVNIALGTAKDLPGAFVIVTTEAKKRMDAAYKKATEGKPFA